MPDARTIIQHNLHPDETLVWVDQPKPSTVLRAWWFVGLMGSVVFLFSGSLFFLGLRFGNLQKDLLLTGISSLITGSGFIFMLLPFWKAIAARWTFYGVTNQRALIVFTWPRRTEHSLYARNISHLKRKWIHKDGRGTLIFSHPFPISAEGTLSPDWRFFGIKNSRKVEEIVGNLE